MSKPKQPHSVIAVFVLVSSAFAADWPQWRGPNRDGVVHGVTVPEKWPKKLKEEWKVPVGEGVASPILVGQNVYLFTRQNEEEVVICLDVAGGKEIWRTEPYLAPYKWQAGEGNFSKGPRSTPAAAEGRVYTYGVSGILSCLDTATGKLLWRNECKPVPPYASNSPLVADRLCIVHFGDVNRNGGLTAFDAATGELKWRFVDGSGPMCVSPIIVDLAGERQIVTATGWEFLGVSASTGKKLWNVKASFGLGTRCITPLQFKDLLIIADYQEPPRGIRLERSLKRIAPKEVWKAEAISLYYTSPVIVGDLLFGLSTRKLGCLFCLDANSGKTLWETDGREGENASILSVGNVLLFLTSAGRLIVVKPGATAYEPIAEYRVSDTHTYAHPVFLGDRILVKDARTLRSLRIREKEGSE